jgi:hypothetical protein
MPPYSDLILEWTHGFSPTGIGIQANKLIQKVNLQALLGERRDKEIRWVRKRRCYSIDEVADVVFVAMGDGYYISG